MHSCIRHGDVNCIELSPLRVGDSAAVVLSGFAGHNPDNLDFLYGVLAGGYFAASFRPKLEKRTAQKRRGGGGGQVGLLKVHNFGPVNGMPAATTALWLCVGRLGIQKCRLAFVGVLVLVDLSLVLHRGLAGLAHSTSVAILTQARYRRFSAYIVQTPSAADGDHTAHHCATGNCSR